jgi:hypothetical protein
MTIKQTAKQQSDRTQSIFATALQPREIQRGSKQTIEQGSVLVR